MSDQMIVVDNTSLLQTFSQYCVTQCCAMINNDNTLSTYIEIGKLKRLATKGFSLTR